jgi:hypothetical protein
MFTRYIFPVSVFCTKKNLSTLFFDAAEVKCISERDSYNKTLFRNLQSPTKALVSFAQDVKNAAEQSS